MSLPIRPARRRSRSAAKSSQRDTANPSHDLRNRCRFHTCVSCHLDCLLVSQKRKRRRCSECLAPLGSEASNWTVRADRSAQTHDRCVNDTARDAYTAYNLSTEQKVRMMSEQVSKKSNIQKAQVVLHQSLTWGVESDRAGDLCYGIVARAAGFFFLFTRTEPPLSRACCIGPVLYPLIAQFLFNEKKIDSNV